MFGVKIRVFKVKESIYVGFKSIHICPEVPPILDFESLRNSNSVKIRSIQAEEPKYKNSDPIAWSKDASYQIWCFHHNLNNFSLIYCTNRAMSRFTT